MKCTNCENAPKNYGEYCKAKRNAEPGRLCPDAFEPHAVYCNKNVNQVSEKESKNE